VCTVQSTVFHVLHVSRYTLCVAIEDSWVLKGVDNGPLVSNVLKTLVNWPSIDTTSPAEIPSWPATNKGRRCTLYSRLTIVRTWCPWRSFASTVPRSTLSLVDGRVDGGDQRTKGATGLLFFPERCVKTCHFRASAIPQHHTDGVGSYQNAQSTTKSGKHPLRAVISSALNGRV
jgi:hypothetical protein